MSDWRVVVVFNPEEVPARLVTALEDLMVCDGVDWQCRVVVQDEKVAS